MRKTRLVLTSVLLSAAFAFASAQAPSFEKGNGVGNFTIGFGNALYTGSGYTSSVPPISASYEVGVKDGVFDKGVIGVGGYLGYASSKYGIPNYEWKYTNFIIGVRGALHYPFIDKFDTYAGLMLAYDYISVTEPSGWSGYGYSVLSSHLILPGFIGGRYYFSDKLAGVAELGWGIAYFNIGLAYKFK
jgi:hypothetical protein